MEEKAPYQDISQNSARAWLLAARPKTLSGAAVPVMIGLSLAYKDSIQYGEDTFQWVAAVLCFLFAFVMQIDANFINDFFDYANGTDNTATRLGPPRACSQGWVSTDKMKHAIALTTILGCLIGLPLVYFGGLEMILIGLLCIVFCFLYTTHLASIGMGDLLVVLFFGVVPVCTVYYIQLHTFSFLILWSSLACGIVIDTLLLVNNFRDRDTDNIVGKNTLVVRIGDENSLLLYKSIGWVACLMGLAFWINGNILAFIMPLLYLVLHHYTYLKIKEIFKGRELNTCLSATARNIFIYGLTVSIGLLL